MERMNSLNTEQQKLVETHLPLVKRVICKYIIVDDTVCGLGFDDLYQEGCFWLCKAALTYQEEKGVKFASYAERVVANGLRTYCRLTANKQKRVRNLSDYADEKPELFSSSESMEEELIEREILHFLHQLKPQYSGVARLGIEAIEWKVKGLSGAEIAKMYGVKSNAVGAWISRTVQKLRKNVVFLSWIEQFQNQKASKPNTKKER